MLYCEKVTTKQTSAMYNWGTKHELKIDNNEKKGKIEKLINSSLTCFHARLNEVIKIANCKTNKEIT